MKLEIEVHPTGSEHFFCDADRTIYKVKVESIRVYVHEDHTKVEHLLKIVSIAENNGFEVFGAPRLTWDAVEYDVLFPTIEEARAKRKALRSS